MSSWSQISRQILIDNSLSDWLSAALVFLLIFAVLPLIRSYLRARRSRYANRVLPPPIALLAYLMDHTSRIVLWIVALYCAERILTLPHRLDRTLEIEFAVGCWLQVALSGRATV